MTTFNGYRNWTVWNVSLWVNNDERLYNYPTMHSVKKQGKEQAGLLGAIVKDYYGKTTPDNAQLRFMRQEDWNELAESLKVS